MELPVPTHDVFDKARREMMFHAFGHGYCLRCGTPWPLATQGYHSTYYGEGDRVMSALCHECWLLLQVPEARIEYYKTAIDATNEMNPENGFTPEQMRAIQRVVANGG